MKSIRMVTTMAGPGGVRTEGNVYDVDDVEADQLVEGGFAKILLSAPRLEGNPQHLNDAGAILVEAKVEADLLLNAAKAEAAQIVETARTEAAQIVETARTEAAQIADAAKAAAEAAGSSDAVDAAQPAPSGRKKA